MFMNKMATRTKSIKSCKSYIWLLIILSLVCVVSSQNDEKVSDNQESTSETEPIQKALKPIYSVVRGFLGVVQPNELDEIEEVYDKWKTKIDNGEITTSDMLQDEKFYDDVVWYLIGFVVCVGIGLLLIVVMILTGCFMCCCRCCCGRCGGQVEPQEGRHSKRTRIICGVLIFIFNTIFMAGCLVLFMSNELIQEQTSKEPQALLPQVNKAIDEVNRYKDTLITDLRVNIADDLEDKLDQIASDLGQASTVATNALNQAFQSTDTVNRSQLLVASVLKMKTSMVEIQDYTRKLRDDTDNLNDQLSAVRGRIFSDLSSCPGARATECNNIMSNVNSIEVKPDFNRMYDVSRQLSTVESLLSSDPSLPDLIQNGVDEYDKVKTQVEQETQGTVNDVSMEIDKVNANMKKTVDDFEVQLHEDFNLNSTHEQLNKYQDEIEEYGTYRWYGGIAIGCMFLLIVVFYYFGLIFGAVGEPPYEDGSSTCNRGVGANLFMANVIFTFLFFWILMIVLIVLFLVGGPMYSEVCRNLNDVQDSPVIDELNSIANKMMEEYVDLDYEINLGTILKECKDNRALYQAFSLDRIVNLTEVLDLDQYNIESEINKLKTQNIDFGFIEILDSNTEARLQDLVNAQLDGINFTSYYVQLDKVPVEPRLSTTATSLEALATQEGNTAFADSLRLRASELRNIDSTSVSQLEQTMPMLKASIQTLQREVEGSHGSTSFQAGVRGLIDSMNELENKLNNGADTTVKDALVALADSVYGNAKRYVEDISNNLQNNIGQCGDLYLALDTAIVAGCDSFLDPWNTFWFSMGMCLIMMIICMIIALVLVTEYRRTDDYEPADNKSFDDPNFDAYAGSYPGDNIPLEDVDRRKPGGGRGHPSQPEAFQNNYHSDGYYPRNGAPAYYGGPPGYDGGAVGGAGGYPASPESVTGYNPGTNAYPTGYSTTPNPPHYYNNRNYPAW